MNSTLKRLISFLIGGFFFIPAVSLASTLYAQYTNNASTALSGGLFEVCLGTGLSGNFPTSMTAYIANSPNSGDALWYRIIDLGTSPCGVIPTAPSTPWNGNDQYTLSETVGSGALGLQTLTTVLVDNIGSSFNPTHYYVLRLQDGNGHNMTFGGSSVSVCGLPQAGDGGTGDSNVYDPFFQFDSSSSYTSGSGCVGFGSGPNLTTHIIAVTPAGGSVVGTSTNATISVEAYISSSDVGDPVTVNWGFTNNGESSSELVGPVFAGIQEANESATFSFVATTSGDQVFSATTSLLVIGQHYFTASLSVAPYFNFFGLFTLGGQTFDSTSTSFIVATSSAYDDLVNNNIPAFNQVTSSAASSTSCGITAYNLAGCFYFWTEFQPSLMTPILASLVQTGATGTPAGFFAHVPFGYVTRFMTIMLGGATTSLPAFTYTAGSSSPAVLQLAGPLSIDFFSYFGEVTAIKADDGSNKDIWDIIDPYIQVLVAFSVLFVILGDLLGIQWIHGEGDEWSDRQQYQIEGFQQRQRTNYPFGKGPVGFDKNGKSL